jgi:hypothetical protein
VAVGHHLPRLGAGGGEAQPEHHVVEPPLEQPQEVLARHALLAFGLREVAPELALEEPVDALRLLLLPQLLAVGRLLRAPQAVLAGRVVAALDGALVREAA